MFSFSAERRVINSSLQYMRNLPSDIDFVRRQLTDFVQHRSRIDGQIRSLNSAISSFDSHFDENYADEARARASRAGERADGLIAKKGRPCE